MILQLTAVFYAVQVINSQMSKNLEKVLLFQKFYDKILLVEFVLIIIHIDGGAKNG